MQCVPGTCMAAVCEEGLLVIAVCNEVAVLDLYFNPYTVLAVCLGSRSVCKSIIVCLINLWTQGVKVVWVCKGLT